MVVRTSLPERTVKLFQRIRELRKEMIQRCRGCIQFDTYQTGLASRIVCAVGLVRNVDWVTQGRSQGNK